MEKSFIINENTAFGRKISRQSSVTLTYLDFLFVRRLSYYIGLLIQFLPSLIISRVIRNKGQQTACLIKNVFALITLSTKDLQRTLKAEAKNRNERLIGTFER
jgi:hypothetical protein